jgi:hypothetical protein
MRAGNIPLEPPRIIDRIRELSQRLNNLVRFAEDIAADLENEGVEGNLRRGVLNPAYGWQDALRAAERRCANASSIHINVAGLAPIAYASQPEVEPMEQTLDETDGYCRPEPLHLLSKRWRQGEAPGVDE